MEQNTAANPMLPSLNIRFVRGDIFKSTAQTLVNTVNCVGVMGAGIAKKAKSLYPEMFQDYAKQCQDKKLEPGRPYLWKADKSSSPWILNFPTKKHWREPSRLEWIEQGLGYFVSHYKEWGITSIAFPALGCGNGGLWWIDVKPKLQSYLGKVDIPVEIFVPPLSSSELAVEELVDSVQMRFPDSFENLYIVRSVHQNGKDTWTDWRRAKQLYLIAQGIDPLSAEVQRIIESVQRKHGVTLLLLAKT